jgi:periplasmic protein TonB
MNETKIKLLIFVFTAALHIVILFFFVFDVKKVIQEESPESRVMKLTDLAELSPPPPSPIESYIPQSKEIAETMIETEIPHIQNAAAAGTLLIQENYLPMHLVSTRPEFDYEKIKTDLIYPPIAFRSGIEGRVMLELFVDRTGTVQRAEILLEEPSDRGFGEAAIKAFSGKKGTPATANGEAVSCHFRYPVVFRRK